jgi:paraquat-inducible protein A
MEHLGKWSMMDVMLLAFLVMMVKVGDMVEFHLGPAVVAFVACVAMSMVASLSFDPHSIWDDEELTTEECQ